MLQAREATSATVCRRGSLASPHGTPGHASCHATSTYPAVKNFILTWLERNRDHQGGSLIMSPYLALRRGEW
jgi:hypothetical protein